MIGQFSSNNIFQPIKEILNWPMRNDYSGTRISAILDGMMMNGNLEDFRWKKIQGMVHAYLCCHDHFQRTFMVFEFFYLQLIATKKRL